MTKTKKLDMELPKEGRFISSEFPILRENLGKLDQALITVEEKIDQKASLQHPHTINDVTGLESALNGKMSADKTFTFADLSDIEGAKDAANNYVLYKSGNNNFTFGSALSLLGAHQHKTEDIVGLDDFRAKINEDLTSYGRLKSPNEWQSYNKFTSKVTMSGSLELLENSSLNLIHNGKVVTNLSTSGSSLKGPLRVDGDVVYTKAQVDAAILAGIKSLKKDLTDKITNWPALADAELLYTQNGKIQWPDWVTDKTKVEITAWGGGGSGGGTYQESLGGGGGGGGCSVWYGYKISLNGHENIAIGQGGGAVLGKNFSSGKSGGTTTVGKNFITATGGKGGGCSNPGEGGVGGNFGLATDEHPGLARGGNGHDGTKGITSKTSGNGGDAGGDTSRGGSGGTGQGFRISGKAGRGFGGGGAGAHADGYYSGAGADGAVLIRLWKD